MISQAAADEQLMAVYFLLAAASAGVFLHAGIKFPWFVFFQKDSGLRPPDPPWNMQAAMIFFAVLCIGLGVWPEPLYGLLPHPVEYVPYTAPHVINMLQLLLFSGLAFFLMLPLMKRTLTITVDTDWFYRRLLPGAIRCLGPAIARADAGARRFLLDTLDQLVANVAARYGNRSEAAGAWSTGKMILLVVVLLGVYVLMTTV